MWFGTKVKWVVVITGLMCPVCALAQQQAMPSSVNSVCIGLRACNNCQLCENVIAIGTDAAANLVRGKNVIVIGKGIDTPATVDDYINIAGELIIRNGVVEKSPAAGVDLSKIIHSEVDDALRSVGVR